MGRNRCFHYDGKQCENLPRWEVTIPGHGTSLYCDEHRINDDSAKRLGYSVRLIRNAPRTWNGSEITSGGYAE